MFIAANDEIYLGIKCTVQEHIILWISVNEYYILLCYLDKQYLLLNGADQIGNSIS